MLQVVEPREARFNLLTPQERECLRLVGQQRSSKEIAHALGISKASVDTYCNRARAKLGVSSRRDAAQIVLSMDAGEGASAPRTPLAAPSQTVAAAALLPPVSSLSPVARLAIIMAGALMLTLSFGMLVSGLQSLDDVVGAAQARAGATAAQSR